MNSTVQNYELERIQPNPFQTRDGEDAEHVKSVAMSIAERGLLQVPSARLNPDGSGMLQLAFGHTRLAGFKFLRDTGNLGFETMPLNLVEMDDQQMFEAAVAENRERKDLTPIEEARAMLVYRDQFHKTSEEVGHLFGLSDSAVRGKLRLLDLPVEIQGMVGKTLTEGAAREVLTYESLPETVKKQHVSSRGEFGSWQPLEKHMAYAIKNGANQEDLSELIAGAVRQAGRSMSDKKWKSAEELLDAEGKKIRLCKGCEFLLQRDNKDYCLDSPCYEKKDRAWTVQYLSQATLLCGIPVLEEGKEDYSGHTHFDWGNAGRLEEIRKNGCENLRLKYDTVRSGDSTDDITRPVKEFKHAKIVCCKRSGACTCLKAAEKGVSVETTGERTEEDLKEMRRQMKQQEKFEREAIDRLIKMASISLQQQLDALDAGSWKSVLSGSSMYNMGSVLKNVETFSQLTAAMADHFFEGAGYSGQKESTLRYLNDLLANRFGLPALNISFEPETTEEVPQAAGKPLMEVFGEEDELATDLDSGNWDTIVEEL